MEKKTKKLWRKWWLLLIILGVIFIFAFVVRNEDEVPGYTLKRGTFIIDIESKGEVKAIDSYIIKSPATISGTARIVRLVPEGEYVKPGDFLIQFDVAEYTQKVQEATNAFETAEASYESKQANIRKQDADLESQLKIENYNLEQNRLRAKNAIYEAENKRKEIEYSLKKAEISYQQLVEKIEATQKINVASIRQSELQVDQARLKLQKAKDDLEKLTILSPTKGLVVYKEIWDGSGDMSKVKVGSSPWRGMSLLEIPDQSGMKVLTTVNEADISKISVGLPVEIRLDAVQDTVFSGSITNIAVLAHRDYRTRNNVFDVEVKIDENDERLKPGMTASCRIIIDEIPDTLFIPVDALVRENEKTGIIDDNGHFHSIQTGKNNGDMILVKAGLQEGDRIRLKSSAIKGQSQMKKTNKSTGENEKRIVIVG